MPDSTATSVYKYYDEFGTLLYVGITSRGMRRQREHNKDKPWWGYVASQLVEHFETREQALSRESSLIDAYRPPFNTQQNPGHESVRAAYLQFRDLPELDMSPLDIVRDCGKQIPLMVLEAVDGRVRLATPLRFASVVPMLEGAGAKAIVGSTKCGAVNRATARSISLEMELTVRKGVVPSNPFMRVSVALSKAGATFNVKNIQLDGHSDPVTT